MRRVESGSRVLAQSVELSPLGVNVTVRVH